MTDLTLTPAEARVIASLVEKSITTPQYYPLTVNALMAASNQKSARHPVMALREGEVGATLNRLAELLLAQRDDVGSRVPKWRHRFQHQLLLKPPALAVLTALMLRGPQTVAELRANAAGLGGPQDTAGVEQALADLADRVQPMAMPLARRIGQSAQRYAHLLCGEPDESADDRPESAPLPRHALEARVAALEARIAELEQALGMASDSET